ncbi:cytosolic phospholipase A2 delta-like isoform X2 [Candoia aspera]|uniref:cytosolic phospholipase A2 delta-like isoform X2 n=1 Tax=Candoia aspera TaxID=51853 RepID=UPI002FD7BD55
MRPGEILYENFSLNSEGPACLEVEFKMESICSGVENIITNGILTAREVFCLEVQINKKKNEECLKKYKNIALMVKESFEEVQTITQDSEDFQFHCVKSWEPILNAGLKRSSFWNNMLGEVTADYPGISLKSLHLDKETKIDLLFTKDAELELQLKVNNHLGDLDVRLGCDLCEAEQDFLCKRRTVVSTALKKVLLLDQELQGQEVPVIAVMATGGGARAMSAFYGHLFALQKLNLLDCVTYLTGASGSTWTMRSLYEDYYWSQKDLMGPIRRAQEYISRSKSNAISLAAMQHYDVELRQRAQEGHSISLTDLWSLIIDRMFHDEADDKLSDQQQAVNQGQNPLPIYLALNVKDTKSTFEFKEWCEFSPYEVGFPKYGAFICSEDFGSEFFMGKLLKKRPESRICYLEGIWSNIFSLNLVDIWNLSKLWQQQPFPGRENSDDDSPSDQSSECQTACVTLPENISSIISGVLTHRPVGELKPNFLRGLQIHKNYHQHKTFSTWQDNNLDQNPNHLTPLEKELCLVDAGYFINTSCPPLLREERNVDVILSFDYNLLETRFTSIEQMGKYCLDQNIPFPKVILTEDDRQNPKECYVFEDKENPNVPIVLHFPLVNDSFRKYKKPGIKHTSADVAEGMVNFASGMSPYKMTDLTYTKDEFSKLINLCDYNIQNNKELILQALMVAVKRRKDSNK